METSSIRSGGCDHPLTIQQKTAIWNPIDQVWDNSVRVPCGKCLPCKKKRVDQWSFRLMQEQKDSYSSYFVTLTYNTDYVPLTDRGKMTLVKTTEQYEKLSKQHRYQNKDVSLQGFFKRLRYYEEQNFKLGTISLEQFRRSRTTKSSLWSNKSIKYYGVGEYGSKRFRPHYHIILFNISDIESIKSAWTFGECHIDEVNKNTIDYTLKYICKPPTAKQKGFDGINEFSLMSKGLGKNYINNDTKSFHSKEYNNFVSNSKGIKVCLPRYYSQKMVSKEQKEQKAIWNHNEAQKQKEEQERMGKKYGYNPEEIRVKIAHANKYKLSNPIKERGND